MKSKVYFTKNISKESILEIYKKLGKELSGNVAVKVHSGEKGNQNFLGPELFKNVINYVKGTVVECNTAYEGERNTTKKHIKLIEEHDKSYIVKETKDGTCIFDNNIVNGIDYLLELSNIDYGVIHGFNIDNDLLEKIVYLVNDILENKNNTSSYELKQLIGNNTGFFNKKTIFKVKKDEK